MNKEQYLFGLKPHGTVSWGFLLLLRGRGEYLSLLAHKLCRKKDCLLFGLGNSKCSSFDSFWYGSKKCFNQRRQSLMLCMEY